MKLINEDNLKAEILKQVKETVQEEYPTEQINELWGTIAKLKEEIKCIGGKAMLMTKEEQEVDEYLSEGYDRARDDRAEKEEEIK